MERRREGGREGEHNRDGERDGDSETERQREKGGEALAMRDAHMHTCVHVLLRALVARRGTQPRLWAEPLARKGLLCCTPRARRDRCDRDSG